MKKCILFAAAIILTAAAVFAGFYLRIFLTAYSSVKEETKILAAENEALDTRRSFLDSDVSKKADNSDEKDRLNKQIADITEDIANEKSRLASAESELNKTKSETDSVNSTLKKLQTGMHPSHDESRHIENGMLLCPAQLDVGRYTATGSGTLTVISLSGSARISENLSQTDTHSYTFNLEEGEAVEARGEITVTELK